MLARSSYTLLATQVRLERLQPGILDAELLNIHCVASTTGYPLQYAKEVSTFHTHRRKSSVGSTSRVARRGGGSFVTASSRSMVGLVGLKPWTLRYVS